MDWLLFSICSFDGHSIPEARLGLRRGGDCICLLAEDGLIDVKGKDSLGAARAELNDMAMREAVVFGGEQGRL